MAIQKFKVMVVIKDQHGISRTIYPTIEASSETDAKQIAKFQYPNGDIRTVSKIN